MHFWGCSFCCSTHTLDFSLNTLLLFFPSMVRAGSAERMTKIWLPSPRTCCVHPGRPPLNGFLVESLAVAIRKHCSIDIMILPLRYIYLPYHHILLVCYGIYLILYNSLLNKYRCCIICYQWHYGSFMMLYDLVWCKLLIYDVVQLYMILCIHDGMNMYLSYKSISGRST